jgi:hypothetical protein
MSESVATLAPHQVQAAQPANDGAVILSMIDKLLQRPDVPVEKLEQMFALHQKVQAEASRREYLAALAALQSTLPAAAKGGNGHNGKTYARYEDVAESLRGPFAAHGFSHWFGIDQTGGTTKITTFLGHAAGHVERTDLVLPLDISGGKTPMHALGSTISYGKRYGLLTVTGIATTDDDDGKAAGDQPSKHATLDEIEKLIAETSSDTAKLLQHFSVEELADMNGKDRDRCKALLVAKLSKTVRR